MVIFAWLLASNDNSPRQQKEKDEGKLFLFGQRPMLEVIVGSWAPTGDQRYREGSDRFPRRFLSKIGLESELKLPEAKCGGRLGGRAACFWRLEGSRNYFWSPWGQTSEFFGFAEVFWQRLFGRVGTLHWRPFNGLKLPEAYLSGHVSGQWGHFWWLEANAFRSGLPKQESRIWFTLWSENQENSIKIDMIRYGKEFVNQMR